MYPNYLVDEFNNFLNTVFNDYEGIPSVLKNPMFYSLSNGGKRLRPVLCMLTSISLNKNYKVVLPTACAIEFIHTYSLIHDDLPAIDNDDFRRGKPSCHKAFGEDMAILAGDGLFAEAFNIILNRQAGSPEIKIKIIKEISKAAGAYGMVAGQAVDVFYTGKKISKNKLNYMHQNKTGKLISASVNCAAIISNADPEQVKCLNLFAQNIGLVYQITDDILDITSSRKKMGKTTGKDSLQNKNTFPKLWGLENSKMIAQKKAKKAIDSLKGLDINAKPLIEITNFMLTRKA